MTEGKFTPEVGSFAMEVWGEIGGGKMPLTGGEKTLLCKDGARLLRSRMRRAEGRGCDGLRGREGGATERGGWGAS